MSTNTEPLSATPELPSLKEMAFNLIGAAKDTFQLMVTKGVVLAPEEEVKKRIDLCWDCEFFQGEVVVKHYVKNVVIREDVRECVCSKCGCAMKTKTRLASSSCPVGKWNQWTP